MQFPNLESGYQPNKCQHKNAHKTKQIRISLWFSVYAKKGLNAYPKSVERQRKITQISTFKQFYSQTFFILLPTYRGFDTILFFI